MKKNDGESYKQFFRACFLNVRLLRCVDSAVRLREERWFNRTISFFRIHSISVCWKMLLLEEKRLIITWWHKWLLTVVILLIQPMLVCFIDIVWSLVTAFHLGKKGYKDRKGYSQQEKDDENWNGQYVRGIKSSKGCLRFAKWKPPREGDRF